MADPTYADDLVLATQFLVHDGLSRPAEITYACHKEGNVATAQTWADSLQGLFVSAFVSLLDSGVVMTKTRTLLGDGTSTFTTGESTSGGTRGTNAISSPPPNVAVLFRKLTGLGGRRNRGRGYLPWMINETDVDEIGNFNSSVQATIQTHCDSWLDLIHDNDSDMVIAQRIYDLPWDRPDRRLTAVELGPPVIALPVDNKVATQRRRLDR